MQLVSLRTLILVALCLAACGRAPATDAPAVGVRLVDDSLLPLSVDTLRPVVITDTVPGDSDDPAIWINPADPAQSLVLGTDKGDSTGGVYAFALDGHIDRARSVTPLKRMNNVDVEYGLTGGGVRVDIAVATERNRQMMRVFALPEMRAIDGGGLSVFGGDVERAPMGIALYRRPRDGQIFAIVGGKSGPARGYLAQYALRFDGSTVTATLVREFGAYSGRKEIEAIVVDDALGYVYYSDEGVGVRKYHADPDSGAAELALFATTGVVADHEGLALFQKDSATGYIVLSDQGANRIHLFTREGTSTDRHLHRRVAVIPVLAQQTDGLDVTSRPLGPAFPAGMLAMMSNRGAFHFYSWADVQRVIDRMTAARP